MIAWLVGLAALTSAGCGSDSPAGAMPEASGASTPGTMPPSGNKVKEDMSFCLRYKKTSGGYVTFGEVFEAGKVPQDSHLMMDGLGAVQMDVKATHADGSVRHAIVTANLPAGSGEFYGNYAPFSGQVEPAINWDAQAFSGLTLRLEGQLGGAVTTATIDVGDALATGEDWISGPFARERMASVPAGPLLNIRLDGRHYKDGKARLRLTFENHKTFSDLPRNISYRATLSHNGQTVFSTDIPEHYRHSGWTKVVSLGADEVAEPVPVLSRLVDSHVIMPYKDENKVMPGTALNVSSPVLPGEAGPLTQYMPSTGGRPEIGPMTHWGALWAMTGASHAHKDMLSLADIGITVPWHFEEDDTGLPVRVDLRPKFWADPRGQGTGQDDFPDGVWTDKPGGWTTDLAHRPQLAYPAYLATGEAAYARALRSEAAYAISAMWPDRRRDDPVVTYKQQLRTTAWSLRTISNAAYLLPDDDPLKDYFVGIRDESIGYLYRHYVEGGALDAAGETEGWIDQLTPRDGPGAMAPWQQDFLVIVVAQETLRETPNARAFLEWMNGFVSGRVLNIDDSNVYAGARMTVMDGAGQPVSSWDEMVQLTNSYFPNQDPFYGAATGYYSTLRAALGITESAIGDADASAALNKMRQVPDGARLFAPNHDGGRYGQVQFNLDTEN